MTGKGNFREVLRRGFIYFVSTGRGLAQSVLISPDELTACCGNQLKPISTVPGVYLIRSELLSCMSRSCRQNRIYVPYVSGFLNMSKKLIHATNPAPFS